MRTTFTPDPITSLNTNEIFVFGSNALGLHYGGAARAAVDFYGALFGKGVGPQGQCYAIPTLTVPAMGSGLQKIDINVLQAYVQDFIAYAAIHPGLFFWVTKIGLGIAGWELNEIAPMFRAALDMPNVALPEEFVEYYESQEG